MKRKLFRHPLDGTIDYLCSKPINVKEALIIAILLVVVIIFLFFREWTMALQQMIDIPVFIDWFFS
jgi:multidrug efflux pump subunit AcrB